MTAGRPLRIGIDVGGTFTDVVLMGDSPEPLSAAKVLNADESRVPAVLAGISNVLDSAGKSPEDLSYIAHGTTLTTNAVIERAGAKTALVTNEGFRDILEIGRFSRPAELIYDVYGRLSAPLVPRHLRFTLSCRINRDGEVVQEPSLSDIHTLVNQLKSSQVEAVAICFLFSFLNDSHENLVASEIARIAPEIEVLTSTNVMPEFREFARTSTTVFAAYCAPVLRNYFSELTPALESAGVHCPVYVYQSNGGIVTSKAVMSNPATTLLSGPAGAVTGVVNLANRLKNPNIITMDIGGTSLDISVVREGRPEFSTNRELSGYPLGIPSLDIRAVGAGGGSVVEVDEVGRIRVGPRSMGARPGPAAYGRGGQTPTLTDVNLLLGFLSPEYFAGGTESLYPELSKSAFEGIAKATAATMNEALDGVFNVAVNQIANSVREVVLERGYDLRDFSLFAFGGGGPIYATAVAEVLGIREITIPPHPGVFAALGMAGADFVHDQVRSLLVANDEAGVSTALEALAALREHARDILEAEGVPGNRHHHESYLEMRYLGQSTELAVVLSEDSKARNAQQISDDFHRLHERTYGYCVPSEPTEIVNVRLRSVGALPKSLHVISSDQGLTRVPQPRSTRSVRLWNRPEFIEVPIYMREDFLPGTAVTGPAIVDEMSSSTIIPEDWSAQVAEDRTITLRRRK